VRNEDDRTPLNTAAFVGYSPVVQYLCEQGADKDARDGDGNTYLDFAAAYWSPLSTNQDGDY